MLLATSTSAHVDGAPADHKCLPPGVEHLSDESLAKELAACFFLFLRFVGPELKLVLFHILFFERRSA